MAKLKKSEAFTVEREKEIQQVSKSCICTVINDTFNFVVFSIDSQSFYCLLIQVVESVNELAQIMKDLSVLVIDQVSKSSPFVRR